MYFVYDTRIIYDDDVHTNKIYFIKHILYILSILLIYEILIFICACKQRPSFSLNTECSRGFLV